MRFPSGLAQELGRISRDSVKHAENPPKATIFGREFLPIARGLEYPVIVDKQGHHYRTLAR